MLVNYLEVPDRHVAVGHRVYVLHVLSRLLSWQGVHATVVFRAEERFRNVADDRFVRVTADGTVCGFLLIRFNYFRHGTRLGIKVTLTNDFRVFRMFLRELMIVRVLVVLRVLNRVDSMLQRLIVDAEERDRRDRRTWAWVGVFRFRGGRVVEVALVCRRCCFLVC